MKRYSNASGDSGISHYEIGDDYIWLRFTGSQKIYEYNNRLTGSKHVEQMKDLAEAGSGLSTYIAQHPEVRDNYKELHSK